MNIFPSEHIPEVINEITNLNSDLSAKEVYFIFQKLNTYTGQSDNYNLARWLFFKVESFHEKLRARYINLSR